MASRPVWAGSRVRSIGAPDRPVLRASLDLAAEEPTRLASLIELWWAEAGRHHVLPLDGRPSRFVGAHNVHNAGRTRFEMWPGAAHIRGAQSRPGVRRNLARGRLVRQVAVVTARETWYQPAM